MPRKSSTRTAMAEMTGADDDEVGRRRSDHGVEMAGSAVVGPGRYRSGRSGPTISLCRARTPTRSTRCRSCRRLFSQAATKQSRRTASPSTLPMLSSPPERTNSRIRVKTRVRTQGLSGHGMGDPALRVRRPAVSEALSERVVPVIIGRKAFVTAYSATSICQARRHCGRYARSSKAGREAQMRTVHSSLAIYGALDQMVTEGNSEAAAIIQRYLPGTTGANAGWFDEIRNFLDIPEGDLPEFASITDSINILEEEHNAFLESDDETPFTKSQQSCLAFVLRVLSRLPNMEPRLTDEDLVRGLVLTVPAGISNRTEVAHQLLGVLRENFTHRDDWPAVMTLAKGLIDPTVAREPLCRTRLRRAHGHNSAVQTTEFTIPTPPPDDSSDYVPRSTS